MSGGVLVVGDVIDDVVVLPSGPIAPDTDTASRIERAAGGSAANTACWLVAAGVPATLVATVGEEDRARHAALLERHGVRAAVTGSSRPTGTIVVLSHDGRRAMLTDRGANLDTAPELVTDGLLATHRHLHLAGHVLAGEDRDAGWREVLVRAERAGVGRSIAPGSAALLAGIGPERFLAVAEGVELLVANLEEARLLTGCEDAEAAVLALAEDHVVVAVTLGAEGALVAAEGAIAHVPAASAELVDATGAGDAFIAGLLAARLGGASVLASALAGTALAGRAVGVVGGRPR